MTDSAAQSDAHHASPVHLPWKEYRRQLTWEAAPGLAFGGERVVYPACSTQQMSARLMMVPPGHGWPTGKLTEDTIFVCVQGEVEYYVDDATYLLRKNDILRIDEGVEYSSQNVGGGPALMYAAYENPGFDSAVSTDPRFVPSDGPVYYMPWAERRRDFVWHAPLSDKMGFHRHSGPFVETTHMRGHITSMPPGQVSPWHGVPGDVIFIQLEGEIEFVAGGRVWPLEPLDILFLPAQTPYIYRNVSMAPEHFFLIMSERPDGARSTYYESDPGWPVSPDVPTYVWSHGKGFLREDEADS
jgi:quercetin dioxygenase-like cupin family protein